MLTKEDLEQLREVIREETEPLRKDIERVELKVEAVHAYQKKAQTEILEKLVESNELNGQEVQKLEERVERIEKQLDTSQPDKN